MLSFLRRLGKWLGEFPAIGFGLFYLAAIPLFALYYNHIFFDFYNSTARYEPIVMGQTAKIENDLKSIFSASHPEISEPKLRIPDEFLNRFRLIPNSESVSVEFRTFCPIRKTAQTESELPISALFAVSGVPPRGSQKIAKR